MEMRERVVQYIGPYKDTIIFQRIGVLNDLLVGDNKVYIDDSTEFQYAHYNNGKLKINIDPTKQVTLEDYEWWHKISEYKCYKAYPIIISNDTDSTTIVGYGGNVPVILEALDKNKNWKQVEQRYVNQCGVGIKGILLKPKEMLCVLAPVYNGDFKTTLRYRLGNSYSSTFTGYISQKQFIVNWNPF